MLLSSIKAVYNRIITHDNDFKESEHPRDNDGKFSSKAGGSERSEVDYCKAFPDGIPRDIAYGDNKHDKVIKGQEG